MAIARKGLASSLESSHASAGVRDSACQTIPSRRRSVEHTSRATRQASQRAEVAMGGHAPRYRLLRGRERPSRGKVGGRFSSLKALCAAQGQEGSHVIS